MAYIVQADLEERLSVNQLIQLTDDVKAGTIIAAVVTDIIADAEAEIDGYVGAQYAVTPISPVPRLLRSLSLDVAVYKLYARRQRVPEDIWNIYKEAMRKLEQIAKGLLLLGPTVPEPITSGAGENFGAERVFTHETMRSW